MREQSLGNRWLTLALWTVLCGISMTAMLWFSLQKTIAVPDVVKEGTDAYSHTAADGATAPEGQNLKLARGDNGETRLCIPLEAGIKAEQIVMENRYMDRQLWIHIEGTSRNFYAESALTGNVAPVTAGYFEHYGSGLVLKMQFEEVMEFQSVLDGSNLYIEYRSPREIYSHIVVVDPAWGGSETGAAFGGETEKELALQFALALKAKLDKTDIKVYYTRLEDTDVEPEKRAALANDVQADMFLRIGFSSDEQDSGAYGVSCLYNGDYFIPEFGSVQLADLLERQVTTSLSGKALGLFPAEEDSVLSLLQVPACEIRPGFLSNVRESALLSTAACRERAAEGMAQAILNAYGQMAPIKTGN